LSIDVLLAGALGALIVFVLGVLLEWWRRERERRGLLRLFLAEINHNEIVIKAIDESGTSLPESPHLDKLKTETWEENQQAALGLPDELLEALERVMNSIRDGLGMRETEIAREPSRPWNPHFYAIFTRVHNTL